MCIYKQVMYKYTQYGTIELNNKKEVNGMEIKSFRIRFSPELHKELKKYCVDKEISMQDFIMKAIEKKAAEEQIFKPDRRAV